jgi:hypothetical protein
MDVYLGHHVCRITGTSEVFLLSEYCLNSVKYDDGVDSESTDTFQFGTYRSHIDTNLHETQTNFLYILEEKYMKTA